MAIEGSLKNYFEVIFQRTLNPSSRLGNFAVRSITISGTVRARFRGEDFAVDDLVRQPQLRKVYRENEDHLVRLHW